MVIVGYGVYVNRYVRHVVLLSLALSLLMVGSMVLLNGFMVYIEIPFPFRFLVNICFVFGFIVYIITDLSSNV